MSIPSEDEIRAFAESIGAVDENGKYTAPRPRLAAGAQKYREELAREAESEQVETTAKKLAQFARELAEEGTHAESIRTLVAAVAPALVRREGLTLKGTRTHD